MRHGNEPFDDESGKGEQADFLLREGLDLIAAFRSIRSEETRRAILIMIAAVAQGERDADALSDRPSESDYDD